MDKPTVLIVTDEAKLRELIADAVNAQGKTYSIKEAAEQLRISVPTVNKLIQDKLLRVTFVGKRVLISQLAINEFHRSGGVKEL